VNGLTNANEGETPRKKECGEIPQPMFYPSEEIFPGYQENKSDNQVKVTVNIPSKTRAIERWQFGVSAFLAVVGFAAICIYGRQLGVMRGQLEEMRRDQRAWVSVPSVNGTKPAVGEKLQFAVHLTNTGRTPARNVVVHPGDEIVGRGVEPNFSTETKDIRLGILSPGSERTYENFVPELTKEGIESLKKQTLSVHGTVTYDDIFGCHHWITYGAYLVDDWSKYAFYSEHNDTDNDSCQNGSNSETDGWGPKRNPDPR
jgi:hypothetical protein